MSTLAGIVATVVVHSSVAALSHFGLTLEPLPGEHHHSPVGERVVARSHPTPQKIADCPELKARVRSNPIA